MYNNGEGVEKNVKEAFKWHSKAAEQGVLDAQIFVAESYESGEGV
jgi:TPR repeat protein